MSLATSAGEGIDWDSISSDMGMLCTTPPMITSPHKISVNISMVQPQLDPVRYFAKTLQVACMYSFTPIEKLNCKNNSGNQQHICLFRAFYSNGCPWPLLRNRPIAVSIITMYWNSIETTWTLNIRGNECVWLHNVVLPGTTCNCTCACTVYYYQQYKCSYNVNTVQNFKDKSCIDSKITVQQFFSLEQAIQ